MTKLFRQAPFADFEITDTGLSVKILLERLYWSEWDQLVKAVNEARSQETLSACPKMLGPDWERITQGYTIPGDLDSQHNKSITGTKIEDYVWRKKLPGYYQVTEGLTEPEDLTWFDGFTKTVAGELVKKLPVVYRPIKKDNQEVITFGQTIPGDIVNGVPVKTAYEKITNKMLVVRNKLPGYRQVIDGICQKGDVYWSQLDRKWCNVRVASSVSGYAAIYRPIMEKITFGRILPGDIVDGGDNKLHFKITENDTVMRRKIEGWTQVTAGDAKIGDIYFDLVSCSWEAINKHQEMDVVHFAAVYRPIELVKVTFGTVLPGDIIDGEPAKSSDYFRSVKRFTKVERSPWLGWEQVTEGCSMIGDEHYNNNRWEPVLQAGTPANVFNCLRRQKQNDMEMPQ